MPRQSRLDAPGILQHVIVRGIEKRKIFLDDTDREIFLKRLSGLLASTGTQCLAWALIPNHFHLLLRSGSGGLASFMRRLLTGYAINFNQRHRRVGHLFQNRYKSIVCEEDPYLLELVRYIHLNPLRARIVKSIAELDSYPWSGHAAILGKQQHDGLEAGEILSHFSQRNKLAIENYRRFVEDGAKQGRRNDLIGGGLRRSQGEIEEGRKIESYDQRVLGSGEFVDYLRSELKLEDRLTRRLPLKELLMRVARHFNVDVEAVKRGGRILAVVEARGVVCYLAVRELQQSGVAVGALLNMKRSGVCLAVRRGEKIVKQDQVIMKVVFGG